MRILAGIILLLIPYSAMANELVILLHGLARSSHSMDKIQERLEDEGYATLNISYPSLKYSIKDQVEINIWPQIEANIAKGNYSKVHFVGYSLGGLISRYIVENYSIANLGNIVQIASPNQGSDLAFALKNGHWYKKLFGPAGQDLAKGSPFIASLNKKVDYSLGVIAGTMTLNPITSIFMLDGKDDGTVTLKSTEIAGMKEHIKIHSSHTLILRHEQTIENVVSFLKSGNFTLARN